MTCCGLKEKSGGDVQPTKSAKRTQLGPGAREWARLGGPRCPAGGRSCETNPISPARGRAPEAKCAEQTQFRPRPDTPRVAKTPYGVTTSGGIRAKRTQFPPPQAYAEGRMPKTNPILPVGGRVTEEIVQNEAKLGEAGACGQSQLSCGAWLGRGAKRAKRTQFGPAGGRTPETRRAKRTQFRRVGRWVESPLFHYSIIPPFQCDAGRAKRSQTWGNWGMRGKAVTVWGMARPGSETCKTNPISNTGGQEAGRACRAAALRAEATCEECETNPIPGAGGP
jgi:hypothetical protein